MPIWSTTEEPAEFCAARIVSVIDVAMKATASAHVNLPSGVDAGRPVVAPPPAADPQPASFGPLHEHDPDEAQGEDEMDDEDDVLHQAGHVAGVRGYLGPLARRRKRRLGHGAHRDLCRQRPS